MNDKKTEVLADAKAALEEEDFDAFQEMIENLPESYWSDKDFYVPMLRLYVDYFDYPDNEYEIGEHIPNSFWSDKTRALVGIRMIFHENNRYNAWDVVPRKALKDRDVAYELAKRAPSQVLSCGIPDELKREKDFVFLVLDGIEEEIRDSFNHHPCIPWVAGECLELYLKDIDASLKVDKEFILRFLDEYSYFDDEYGLLYDWMEPELWNDKPFVMEILKIVYNDKRALSHLSSEMLADEDIKELIA